jgi:hypothetical protein
VMSTPEQIVNAASDSITRLEAVYQAAKDDDRWFTGSVSVAAMDDLGAALQDAEADLRSNEISGTIIPDILAKCDAFGQLAPDRQMFNPGCELGDYLKTVPYRGDALPLIYNLQGQIGALKPKFDALKNYDTLFTAVKYEWRNALLCGLMWAVMAAVFAGAVLLYRRQLLWDALALKKLPDFVPQALGDRELWLRAPLYDIGRLSPLEALRYPAFRALLADHMKAQVGPLEPPRLRIVA